MEFLRRLGIDKGLIDWDIDPLDTYGMFECRGDMDVVRSSRQRFYYFFIDNWQQPPRLCLMERGIRHARVLAEIEAPDDLLASCIAGQGKAVKYQSLAIDDSLRQWLRRHVVEPADFSRVRVLADRRDGDTETGGLPAVGQVRPQRTVSLRWQSTVLREEDIAALANHHDFYEQLYNPDGGFRGCLADPGGGETVVDLATGLMWQRGGSDIGFYRRQRQWIAALNQQRHAGYDDWRLPTVEEALSLLLPTKNRHGLHVHGCFSPVQGFIYTADRHKPGGYWFVDFNQARVFWAGGTFNGGFARLCRTFHRESDS